MCTDPAAPWTHRVRLWGLANDDSFKRAWPFLASRERSFGIGYKRLGHKVARFREIDKDRPNVHHGALELPDGQIVLGH